MALPYIPETITVHLGAPDAPAQNLTVPFPDYIKNVASSEIYPTWPENALRANLYAEISYALNRVYTEWYRSRGYDFDITNSTQYDQSFVPNRDVFDNISALVDEMFNDYLTRGAGVEPFFAQYCDGRRTTCDGLSQWGTVPLAEAGETPYEILTTYYGDDISIVFDAPVAPNLGGSYPDTALRLGMTGEDVRTIQTRLNRVSTNYPNIPKIYPVDGVFRKSTEDAVEEFQRTFRLTADGIVGKATWYRLAYLFVSVKKLAELSSEGLLLSEIPQQAPPPLSLGDTGTAVRMLQYFLSVVGAYYDAVPANVENNGVYDETTRTAIVAYQGLVGLTPDGLTGPQTWNALVSTYQAILKTPYGAEQAVPLYPGRLLVEGLSGEDVTQVQTYLSGLHAAYPEIPETPVTGYYGDVTAAAVRAAQELFGLDVNGTVGPLTWDTLATQYETLRTGTQTAEGQYPGYVLSEGGVG